MMRHVDLSACLPNPASGRAGLRKQRATASRRQL
jgi:hypothetical protein